MRTSLKARRAGRGCDCRCKRKAKLTVNVGMSRIRIVAGAVTATTLFRSWE